MNKKIVNEGEIVYYSTETEIVKCIFQNGNIHIENSYLVKDDDAKLKIIEHILKESESLIHNRTKKDMFNEWKVHNHLYSLKIKKDRTKDLDLELNQNIFMKFAYWLFSKFAPKNI